MDVKELTSFLGNHCRFKIRDGRNIYGVIWENNSKYFFSSKERHDAIFEKSDNSISPNKFDQIDPTDIILAERILEENV